MENFLKNDINPQLTNILIKFIMKGLEKYKSANFIRYKYIQYEMRFMSWKWHSQQFKGFGEYFFLVPNIVKQNFHEK